MNTPAPLPTPAAALRDTASDAIGSAAGDAALADRLRALAHPVRLTVLRTLGRREGCVCGEIVRALPLAQSTVSQHLKVLLEAGLIRSRSEGPRSSYCLDRDVLTALRDEIDQFLSALAAPEACCPGSVPAPSAASSPASRDD